MDWFSPACISTPSGPGDKQNSRISMVGAAQKQSSSLWSGRAGFRSPLAAHMSYTTLILPLKRMSARVTTRGINKHQTQSRVRNDWASRLRSAYIRDGANYIPSVFCLSYTPKHSSQHERFKRDREKHSPHVHLGRGISDGKY